MPTTYPLATAFGRAAPRELGQRLGSPADLDEALMAVVSTARAAWPDIEVDDLLFVEHLAARMPADGSLEAIHATDLYLAFACLLGDSRAIGAFETSFLAKTPAALGSSQADAATVDEVLQLLRQKLFVRQGEVAPKIADFSGRGPLLHWVRAAAVRTLQDLTRARHRHVESTDEALADIPAAGQEAEVAFMKGRYGPEFKAAFHDALATVSPRDRNLLRLHYVDGISPDEIGRLYRAHRTTVWRWITGCRQELFLATRRLLAERVPMAESELSSLMEVVRSQLDVSISRVLREG